MAIDLGVRATRADPLRPQYWDTLGLAYVSGDRLRDASTAFDRAVKTAPYDVRYIADLAQTHLLLAHRSEPGSRERALELADQAVKVDPNNPRAHVTRAVVMHATGKLPEALSSVQRALALDPASGDALLWVTAAQVYLDSGRPIDAIRVARQGLTVSGPRLASVPLRYELARALFANGQAEDALAELDTLLSIQPNDASAIRLRGEIAAALGK